MAEEFNQDDIYTLTDEDGVESEFGLLDSVEVEGIAYFAMVPMTKDADGNYDVEGEEYVILKQTKDENGDDILLSVDDDDECDRIADLFEDRMFGEVDHDAE